MWGHLLEMTLCNCLDVPGLQVGDRAADWVGAQLPSVAQGWWRFSLWVWTSPFISVQKRISSDKHYFELLGCDISTHQDLKPSMCY